MTALKKVIDARKYDLAYLLCREALTYPEETNYKTHIDYLEIFAELAANQMDLKTLTFEIYPLIEQKYLEYSNNVTLMCTVLKIRQIHDSAIMHVDFWRNYLEV